MEIKQVSIALKPNVYTTFRDLSNTLSNTLGEYVDNAVQNYFDNKNLLQSYEPDYKLCIRITMDWEQKTLTIVDNAAGINEKNYLRAFEPANIPENRAGLNEYGMGMKTASVWLADNWTITTKALGESKERILSFDLNKVVEEEKEVLAITEKTKSQKEHYTKIILTNLSKNAPKPNSLERVKKHLSSIYRYYLRNDEIEIFVNEEKLTAPNYKILNAPFYKNPDGGSILWKKEIHFNAGKYKANGFIAILDEIQQGANGLVLLRRGRVIVGGGDEHYFPTCIFGSVGTFKYKRLFGELELDGFEVTFNKNSFKAEDDLQALLEDIRDEIRKNEPNIFLQADGYRQRSRVKKEEIAQEIKETFEKKNTSALFKKEKIEQEELKINNVAAIKKNEELINNSKPAETYTEPILIGSKECELKYELITDTESMALYSVRKEEDVFVCKINLNHSFFDCYPQFKKDKDYEPVIRILMAFAKAEIKAPDSGTTNVGNVRNLFNQYILEND
ncbi:MAG: ATP-binding protein [Treponemataceae bacterium]|nr:ATP-binding protein [Treponemataceae bacterium]